MSRRPPNYFTEHEIAARHEPRLIRAFIASVREARKHVNLDILTLGLENGHEALALSAFPFREIENTLSTMFVSEFTHMVEEAGTEQSQHVPIHRLQKIGAEELLGRFGFRFDVTNPRSLSWIFRHAGELVAELSVTSQIALQNLLARAFQEGFTVRQVAQHLRNVVGLNAQQAQALETFRLQAFNSLNPNVAELRVIRYGNRLLKNRAETIARTETIRAAAQGQQELWFQMADQGILDPETTRRRWIVTPDERLCPICAPMPLDPRNIVRLDQPFYAGNGNLVMNPPDPHPRCRCATALVFLENGRLAA